MPTSRPFAYNPSQTFTPGVNLFGYLSVGPIGSGKIAGLTTWNGPDEDLGYVIAKVVYDNSQPTPIAGVSASVAFYRSSAFTEAAFLHIVNRGLHFNYSEGSVASNYLLANGFWTNYPTDDPDALIYMSALDSVGGNSTFYYDPSPINQLFIDLKATGLYYKMEAFYPMIGNAASSQRLNAKSVGGVRQSGFDLFFYGGWNFNYYSNGPYTARGNGSNTVISVNKQYTTLASLKDTHFAVYGNDLGSPGYDTAAADVFAFDLYTTNGIEYRFVEMRLTNSTNPFLNEPRNYNSTYDYPGNILPQDGPVINTNGTSTHNSFAIMSYDNISDNGTNNFRINGNAYTNYNFDASDTVPSDPADTTYGAADLIFGYYYDWYNGQQFYTGAAYGWLGFGTSLDADEQSNYQEIVNNFMAANGKSTY